MSEEHISLGRITLSSGTIRVSDVSMFFDDFYDVELPRGDYIVEAIVSHETHDDVLSLWIVRPVEEYTCGRDLGLVPVTFGQVGVFDLTPSLTFLKSATEDELARWHSAFDIPAEVGIVLPLGTLRVPVMRSATGSVRMVELTSKGQCCGILIQDDYS